MKTHCLRSQFLLRIHAAHKSLITRCQVQAILATLRMPLGYFLVAGVTQLLLCNSPSTCLMLSNQVSGFIIMIDQGAGYRAVMVIALRYIIIQFD